MEGKKSGKKKRNFLRENYILSWNYIKDSRKFIYFVGLVFLIFAFTGFAFPVPEYIQQIILDFIEKLLLETDGLGWSQLTGFIFLNNIQSSFFGMMFGIVLGIYPLFGIIANGYLLGFVSGAVVSSSGSTLVLWRLVPHGVFEIPALLISMGLGVKLGTFVFKKKKMKSLKNYFFNSARVFLFVIIPLLVIAAVIESTLIALA